MSAEKSKPKTTSSTVSKTKSTSSSTTTKTSSGEGSLSKSHPSQSVKSKEQLHTAVPAVKDPAITPSTTAKPSKFYFACRNNEIDSVTSLLPTLTLEEINQIEPNGSTALHAAAYYGNKEVVKLLLSKGALRMIKNCHGCTPYDEAKSEDIKKLLKDRDEDRTVSKNRFTGEKGPSFEWIFVKGDPSSYASFNRKSLWKCRSDEEFERLCRGIQRYYVNENGPLADEKGMEIVRLFIDKAIKGNDPTQIVRAYTANTGFYGRINRDLSQLPTHWSGSKYERDIASIMIFHPALRDYSFTGETYRGMTMSLNDLKEYVVDSIFMNKAFLSTSKERILTESFAAPDRSSTDFRVICKYLIKHSGTALAIEDISEFPSEKEVLILPYASFKVKNIRKSTEKLGAITEIDVEEEEEEKWTKQKSYQSSQTHTSVKKKTSGKQHDDDDDDDSYAKMYKDSQEKGKIDPADLAKWKQKSFGIDPESDTYGKMWNDAKKGKFGKSDLTKWKNECGVVTEGDDNDDSDLESYDGENHTTVFTASNEQSYATSKKFTSKQPFDMKDLMKTFENDSDD